MSTPRVAAAGRHGASMHIGADPLIGGEAVPVDLRVARIGSRAVAAFLDLLIEILALGFLSTLLVNLTPLDAAALQAITVTVTVLVVIGYPVICEAAWGGRTLGKAAMGLRAARDDGGPLRFRHALVRGLIGFFVEKPGITLGLAAVLCSLISKQGKRLGDLFAGTVVLQVRMPITGAYVPPMPPPLAGWASTLDLTRLPDGLALQCRQFLGRAAQLSDGARERLGTSLVAAVQEVVAPPPPPGTPGWAYLSAVLAERRRREELRAHGSVPAPPGWQPVTPAGTRPPTEPASFTTSQPEREPPGPFTLPG